MPEYFSKENIDKTIQEIEKKAKKDKDLFSSQRKVALTWNIIFFIGILTTTIVISLISKSDSFNLKELFISKADEKISLLSSITALLISFITGILGSYFSTKKLSKEDRSNVEDFVKESFLQRLEKSKLNPKRHSL